MMDLYQQFQLMPRLTELYQQYQMSSLMDLSENNTKMKGSHDNKTNRENLKPPSRKLL